MSIRQTTSAVILAGGRSLRMGMDKAFLRLHPGGSILIETVASRLSEGGLLPALLVTNTPEKFAWLNIPTLADEIPGGGALGGILTALLHSPSPRTLIVACDMPLLSPALLQYMASLPLDADALVPRWAGEDGSPRIEPLHAIYTSRCIELIRRRLQAGKLRVTDALTDIDAQYVEEAEMRRLDPQLDSFRNVNTPGEWAELRAKLRYID